MKDDAICGARMPSYATCAAPKPCALHDGPATQWERECAENDFDAGPAHQHAPASSSGLLRGMAFGLLLLAFGAIVVYAASRLWGSR